MTSQIDDLVFADLATTVSRALGLQYHPDNDIHGKINSLTEAFLDNFVLLELNDAPLPNDKRFGVVKIGHSGPAYSHKIGNLTVNWRNVVKDAPSYLLTGAGAAFDVRLGILAGIVIFSQLNEHAKIRLADHHVTVVQTLLTEGTDNPPALPQMHLQSSLSSKDLTNDQIDSAIADLLSFNVFLKKDTLIILNETVSIST